MAVYKKKNDFVSIQEKSVNRTNGMHKLRTHSKHKMVQESNKKYHPNELHKQAESIFMSSQQQHYTFVIVSFPNNVLFNLIFPFP